MHEYEQGRATGFARAEDDVMHASHLESAASARTKMFFIHAGKLILLGSLSLLFSVR